MKQKKKIIYPPPPHRLVSSFSNRVQQAFFGLFVWFVCSSKNQSIFFLPEFKIHASKMINLHPTLQKVSSISKVAYRSMIATELARLLNADFKLNFIDHDDNDNNNSNNNDKSATIFGATLTFEGICSISQLIDYISKPDQIIEEGLFRKSGVRSRQQELRTMISSGQTIEIDCQKYSVHDCCDLLKRFVSELPQSILTNELQKFFLQSLRLESGQKQLDTIRLLILLLPAPNRNFLYELLTLFDNIAKHSNQNRMNIENLATIFSPSIFRCQWSMTTSKSLSSSSTNSSHQQSNTVQNMLLANQESIQCLSIMIQNVRLIFEPPEKLINDAVIYLSNHIRLQKRTSGPENMISVTNLSALPTTKFCATTEQHYSAKDYTERQVCLFFLNCTFIFNENSRLIVGRIICTNAINGITITIDTEKIEKI